jgi:phosphoserine aminotransferase
VYNFSAGPAVLPEAVLAKARDELLEWDDAGASVMEISHRSKDFMGIAEQAENDLRELLAIPANYKVLFLQGGATLQFAMVPMNLLGDKKVADYINTGHWSRKAMVEAERFTHVHVAATSEDSEFTTVPPQSSWQLHPDTAYVHFTPNETIGGLEFHWTPDTGDVPLVADMSSTILSRPIDVSSRNSELFMPEHRKTSVRQG